MPEQRRPELIDCVWITWEEQRRTETLSEALGIELIRLDAPRRYLWKVLKLSVGTLMAIARRRPRCVIVQNPSMALAGLTALIRPIFRYRLIVDRHSNFKFPTMDNPALKYRVFHWLSRMTIRAADLTIVTNDFLARTVDSWGGRSFILEDKLPDLHLAQPEELSDEQSLLYVASFSADEPVEAVIDAARQLEGEATLYISGNPARLDPGIRASLPPNVHLTGFLPEAHFQSLMASVDVVIGLTRQDHTLLCCAYEAVSLGKPLVLSDTMALRRYFRRGAVYTGHQPEQLAEAFRSALRERDLLAEQAQGLAVSLEKEWQPRFSALVAIVRQYAGEPATVPGS
jgi:glycosyltransferase involved in cell wall biosynthesis